MRCLAGSRFTMHADILRQVTVNGDDPTDIIGDEDGQWIESQNPITGEIHNKWEPAYIPADDPSTPDINETVLAGSVPCLARGVVSGGVRMGGTTEVFGDTYENIDIVKMWVPASVNIHKRDQVTNIREKKGGRIIWRDEEYADGSRPTIFNVNGVIPLLDAFNRHTENFVVLEKVQGGY